MTIESWLPPTAMAALLLFIAREVFDLIKKKRADQRKVKALKTYLARECELIKWSIKKLLELATDISEAGEINAQLTFEKLRDGSFAVNKSDENGERRSSYVVRYINSNAFEKYFLDIVTLDDTFFKEYEEACTSVAELNHVWDSLMDWERLSGGMEKDSFLASLSEYAESEIRDAEQALTSFYKYCTGKDQLLHRLR